MAILGFNRAANLRFGVADEWGLLSTAWIHDAGRLRRRVPQHAPGKRRAVADADHPGRNRTVRQVIEAWKQHGCAARSRRRDAGGVTRCRSLAARQESGGRSGIQERQQCAPRR